MVIKPKFKRASEAIASYDYYDFASGFGYKTFYPCVFIGSTYGLVTETLYSQELFIQGDFDEDFDIEFKRACDIKGVVLVNVPVVMTVSGDGNPYTFYTVTVYINHWDGTTETPIANGAITRTAIIGGGASTVRDYDALKIPITTLTHFTEGESLRVSIVMVKGSAITVFTGLDPKNRTDATFTQGTQTSVRVPFRFNN